MSDFLIDGLKEANQSCSPNELQTSHHWIILWGFVKYSLMSSKYETCIICKEKIVQQQPLQKCFNQYLKKLGAT
jgi:hypothetical protein